MTRPPRLQVAMLGFLLVVLALLCVKARAAPESTSSRQIQRQEAQRLAWRRDPFTRAASIESRGGMTLSGILWDAQQPMAILNGQIVHVGETVEGYRVLEIAKDHVTVTDGSRVLQLNPQ